MHYVCQVNAATPPLASKYLSCHPHGLVAGVTSLKTCLRYAHVAMTMLISSRTDYDYSAIYYLQNVIHGYTSLLLPNLEHEHIRCCANRGH